MLFAHQGGWDELLYIGIPVMGALWMLKVSERKARERAEHEAAAGEEADGQAAGAGDEDVLP